MLNWAVRYWPIVRALRLHLNRTDSILEVGSGSVGLAKFYDAPFVGCDTVFLFKPIPPLCPVLASAANLPFADRTFDGVIASDVLEHIPPALRKPAIAEILRVTRKLAIFGFPSGNEAFDCDRKLARAYEQRHLDKPPWLDEHISYGFPAVEVFDDFNKDWQVASFGNESVGFHLWMMNREMSPVWNFGFRSFLRLVPGIAERMLQRVDRAPFYRKIVVLRPKQQSTPVLGRA